VYYSSSEDDDGWSEGRSGKTDNATDFANAVYFTATPVQSTHDDEVGSISFIILLVLI